MVVSVSIEQLIMSDNEIAQRIGYAGEERVMKIYISDGGDPILNNRNSNEPVPYSRTPDQWQYDYIHQSIYKISKYIDLFFLEVDNPREANYEIVIHPDPQKDSVSGGKSLPDTLMISHQSGLNSPFHMEPDADSVSHNSDSKAIQTEIFLHELGHLLGLEHPWDNEDGDFAVQSYQDAHESTRMGYNEHLSGEKKWYEDIDIMALQTIWGESKSTKILDFNEGNGLFMSGERKTLFVDGNHSNFYVVQLESSGSNITVNGAKGWQITGSNIGTDTIIGFKRLEFNDGTLALDIDPGETAGQAYRLYQAAFARTPDMPGVAYHMNDMESNGLVLWNIANNFLASPEFKSKYGESPTDEEYVNLLYQNVLGRSADPVEEVGWYREQFDTGAMDWAAALIGFAESPENVSLVAPQIVDGIWMPF
jgi:hypothetical protein